VIRRASAADRAALFALLGELLEEHAAIDPAFALAADAGAARVQALDSITRDPHAAVWVADRAGAAAGFVVARIEAAPPSLAERARAVITELYVAPAERRRGHGRALVAAALDWARAQSAARVEVRVAARNAEAQAFWRAQGFGDFVDVLDRRL
jgi:ribosomal protein S18 acetylase RimI-like enzyme